MDFYKTFEAQGVPIFFLNEIDGNDSQGNSFNVKIFDNIMQRFISLLTI